MPKKQILIIEDEEILLDVLDKKLTRANYEVLISRNGEEGLEILKEEQPDLILLDILMPKMNGFEFLEKKNKIKKIKDIPVMIVSNSGQPVELSKAKKLGVDDWIIKVSFDPDEVLEKVKKIFTS